MVKQCNCLLNAEKITHEMLYISERTKPDTIKEDADYITGMIFVVDEAELVDTSKELKDILDSVKVKDIDKFRNAVTDTARQFNRVKCW